MLPITTYTKTDFAQRNIGSPTPANTYYYTKTGYRQKKPYNLNLAYSMWTGVVTRYTPGYSVNVNCDLTSGSSITGCHGFSHVNLKPQNTSFSQANQLITDATDQARERFISQMKGNAGIGVDLAERKQSMSMIAKRSTQLLTAMRSLRRGKIPGFLKPGTQQLHLSSRERQLEIRRLNRKIDKRDSDRLIKQRDKEAADLFLELHFGWEPLVKDIYAAIDVLQGPIPMGRIVGRSRRKSVLIDLSATTGGAKYTNKHCINVKATVGASVSINNPNLALANQLGLINPAVIAWEIVPFSFLADWFINVGEFLESFTEFAGYAITDPFTMTYSDDTSSWSFRDAATNAYGGGAEFFCRSSRRVLSLPGVTLKARMPDRISPVRAITAVSLLIQQGFQQ